MALFYIITLLATRLNDKEVLSDTINPNRILDKAQMGGRNDTSLERKHGLFGNCCVVIFGETDFCVTFVYVGLNCPQHYYELLTTRLFLE